MGFHTRIYSRGTTNIFLVSTIVILHFTSSVEFESSLIQLPRSGFSRNRRGRVERVLRVTAYGAVGDGVHDDTEVKLFIPFYFIF